LPSLVVPYTVGCRRRCVHVSCKL